MQLPEEVVDDVRKRLRRVAGLKLRLTLLDERVVVGRGLGLGRAEADAEDGADEDAAWLHAVVLHCDRT